MAVVEDSLRDLSQSQSLSSDMDSDSEVASRSNKFLLTFFNNLSDLSNGHRYVIVSKSMCQRHRKCPCKSAGLFCGKYCLCGTRRNPCKNKVRHLTM